LAVTLTLAPFGLKWSRQLRPAAINYSANVYYIKSGYNTKIAYGDLVETRTGAGNFGYIGAYTPGDSHVLGVFYGLLPYYDTALQQWVNKRFYNGGTEVPSADLACWVIDDPTAVFTAQLGNANASNPGNILDRGGNIDIANNSLPNAAGISTAFLDATTYNNTTATLPLRIVGISQMFQSGYNPVGSFNTPVQANQPTNNYLDVVLNTSEFRTSTGI
jgi:hypothetical protein